MIWAIVKRDFLKYRILLLCYLLGLCAMSVCFFVSWLGKVSDWPASDWQTATPPMDESSWLSYIFLAVLGFSGALGFLLVREENGIMADFFLHRPCSTLKLMTAKFLALQLFTQIPLMAACILIAVLFSSPTAMFPFRLWFLHGLFLAAWFSVLVGALAMSAGTLTLRDWRKGLLLGIVLGTAVLLSLGDSMRFCLRSSWKMDLGLWGLEASVVATLFAFTVVAVIAALGAGSLRRPRVMAFAANAVYAAGASCALLMLWFALMGLTNALWPNREPSHRYSSYEITSDTEELVKMQREYVSSSHGFKIVKTLTDLHDVKIKEYEIEYSEDDNDGNLSSHDFYFHAVADRLQCGDSRTGWVRKDHAVYLFADEQCVIEFVNGGGSIIRRVTPFPSHLPGLVEPRWQWKRKDVKMPEWQALLFSESEIATFGQNGIQPLWKPAARRIFDVGASYSERNGISIFAIDKDRRLTVLNADGALQDEFILPDSIDFAVYSFINSGITSTGRRYFICHSQKNRATERYFLLNKDSSVEKSWTKTENASDESVAWTVTRKGKADESFIVRPQSQKSKLRDLVDSAEFICLPNAIVLTIINYSQGGVAGYAVLLASCAFSALLCWLRLRKHAKTLELWTWIVAALLMGWAVFLACLLARDLPANGKCPSCGKKSRLDKASCKHCNAKWGDGAEQIPLLTDDATRSDGLPQTK